MISVITRIGICPDQFLTATVAAVAAGKLRGVLASVV